MVQLKYRILGVDTQASLQSDGKIARKATIRVTASGPLTPIGMPMGFVVPDIPAEMVADLDAGDEVTLTIEKIVPAEAPVGAD